MGTEIVDNLRVSIDRLIDGIDVENPTGQHNSLCAYNLALLQAGVQKLFYGEDSDASQKSDENALFLLTFAATRGDYDLAQHELAQIFRDGLYGVTSDTEKAKELFAIAAKKGYAPAQFELAELMYADVLKMYEENSTEAQKFHRETLDWYSKAQNKVMPLRNTDSAKSTILSLC